MKRFIALILVVFSMITTSTVMAEEVSAESIKIGVSSPDMKIGETQKIIVYVTPANAAVELEYESNNSDVVMAAVGTLIAKGEGIANITVKVSGTDLKDSIQITVSDEADDEETEDKEDIRDEEIKVNKITVGNKSLYLERYETERIEYEIFPDNALNHNVSFKSSNTSVATVDSKGYVYAKKKGNATITIKSDDGGATATVKVYVSDNYDDDEDYDTTLRNVYIAFDDEIVKDKLEVMETTTVQLGVKASPSTASKKVKWRSSNKRIATVDSNGKVTGVKKGKCTIYVTSAVNSSKKDSITVEVTEYVRFPDKITITPQEKPIYETGNQIQLFATFYPEDTTETDIIWEVYGGATISQTGLVQIADCGEITVKAYSSNRTTVGEYKFNAEYSENHFIPVGTAYNTTCDRKIEMYFDNDVNGYSAASNIFATADESGNGERIDIFVMTEGKKVEVSPTDEWPKGDIHIFIKNSLCDIVGDCLGKNLKYKLNIRGNENDK